MVQPPRPATIASIDALLQEDRRYQHSEEFDAGQRERSEECTSGPRLTLEAFWAEQAQAIDWFTPWKQVLGWDPPKVKWFEGGDTKRHLQLRGPPREDLAPQQGRHHLGGRARD